MKNRVLLSVFLLSLCGCRHEKGVSVILSVSPNTVNLSTGQTQQYTAVDLSTNQPTPVTWHSSVVNTITDSGLFTAPTVAKPNTSINVYAISTLDPSKSSSVYAFVSPPAAPPVVTYPKAYTGIAVVQAGPPPFSANSRANAVVRVLAPYNTRYALLTDHTFLPSPSNNGWFVPPGGGGAFGIIDNWPNTLIHVHSSGGGIFLKWYNPTTMQSGPNPPPKLPCQDGSFSRNAATPNIFYCLPALNTVTPLGKANGTTLYTLTFAALADSVCGVAGKCFDPTSYTWAQLFDFGTCPMVPQRKAAKYQWHSGVGVAYPSDQYLTESFSWTGVQNTAHLWFTYDTAAKSCKTIDTQGNGTNPLLYTSATESTPILNMITGQPLAATFNIHDQYITGTWASIAQANCVGADCGATDDGGPILRFSDYTMYVAAYYQKMSGHGSLGVSFRYNDGNPQMWQHPMINPTVSTQLGVRACQPCEDSHESASVANDADPLLSSVGGAATTTWTTPYHNEVLGYATDASKTVYRFGPTWSAGYPKSNFYSGYAITGFCQQRQCAMLATDMQCGLRPADCGSDVVMIDLTGK